MPALACLGFVAAAAWADEFDDLRLRWRGMLTGGDGADLTMPEVRERLAAIDSTARGNWTGLLKAPDRRALWSDLTSATVSSQITSSWKRVKDMALAWATPGTQHFGNPELLADVRSAMAWLEANRYNERVANKYDNWWDWEIGTPMEVGDLLVLLYEQLTPEEIRKCADAVERFAPDPRVMITNSTSTGANRVWKCKVAALRGVVVKDPAKVRLASDSLGPVFAYVTSGDGFYEDGSFIQHTRHPYTGGYGVSLLAELADLMYLMAGSAWEVRDERRDNLYRWVFESFEPVVYRGAFMDMLRGREISRSGSADHAIGHRAATAILRVSMFAPADAAPRMRSLVKEWFRGDTSRAWSSSKSIEQLMTIRQLLDDEAVTPRGELTGSWVFAGMDRAVHLRPGWGFGIAMHSSRVYNYESINTENLNAWHSGDGVTYLYNGDLTQFSDNFWPTIDPQRLPGTTVVAGSTARQSQTGGSNIVGGVTLDGFAAVMMRLVPDGRQLDAKKSWFLFDDEVVALGADIKSAAEGKAVETIVENRRVTGEAAFTMDESGAWAHLEGAAGYVFPNGSGWESGREERSGAWRDINGGGSSTLYTRRYQTIWFDHGATPSAATYVYALLPGWGRQDTAVYAASPPFRIVENTGEAQAVADASLKLRAISFWNNAVKTAAGVTSDKAASVLVQESDGTLSVAVADPTQANTGTIRIEIDRAAAGVVEQDATVTVEQLAPSIHLLINVRNARGKTHRARVELKIPP
jgi:hyaluronate lyase